jgi:hypothetical protein
MDPFGEKISFGRRIFEENENEGVRSRYKKI